MTLKNDSSRSQKIPSLAQSVLSDTALLINHNKALILVCLSLVFIVAPFAQEWNLHRIHSDYRILYRDPQVQIIEGEKPVAFNRKLYGVEQDDLAFNNKYMYVETDALPEEQAISLKYIFTVDQEGLYKIFVGGGDPGSLEKKYISDHSPYEVIIDGTIVVAMNEEKKMEFLMETFGHDHYLWYSYSPEVGLVFSKVGEFSLTPGDHQIEFRISRPVIGDNRYLFALDAIFVVPADWESGGRFQTLPDDLFSY